LTIIPLKLFKIILHINYMFKKSKKLQPY